MSTAITPVDLSAATVGYTNQTSWLNQIQQFGGLAPTPSGQKAHLQLYNESGCGLEITLNGSGSNLTIPAGAWPLLELEANDTGLSYTVLYVISNAQVAKLVGTLYAPGEPVPATPVLGNSPVGGTVTTSTANEVVNDGNGGGTVVVEATPLGGTGSTVTIDNLGNAFFAGAIGFGVVGVGNGVIQYNTGTSGETVFQSPTDVATQDIVFILPGGRAFSIGSDGTTTHPYIDASGLLHLIAPPTLISGNQETGMCGGGWTATAASQNIETDANFKTVMTNVPTSLTLSVLSQSNANAPYTGNITKYGFTIGHGAPASGFSAWHGEYTTVGNCLLSVDTTASTFVHHCDKCGHVSTAAVSALRVHQTSFTALAYDCPSCGASEAFNTALTAEDEADTTPQGSGQYATTRGAQARMIRQLQALLSLPVK